MRLGIVLAVALLSAPTLVAAETQQEPRDLIAMTVVRVGVSDVFIEWTPVPGAASYTIYRGTDLAKLEFLDVATAAVYHDASAPDADVWYVVVTEGPNNTIDDLLGPMRGRCISSRGAAGVSVTAAHCMPTEMSS